MTQVFSLFTSAKDSLSIFEGQTALEWLHKESAGYEVHEVSLKRP